MMAHILPIDGKADPLKISDNDRRLPDGSKVNFGNGSSRKQSKKSEPNNKGQNKDKSYESKSSEVSKDKKNINEPLLLNGEKLSANGKVKQKDSRSRNKSNENASSNIDKVSDNRSKDNSKNKKKSSNSNEPSLPNGEKPNFYNDSSKSKKKNTEQTISKCEKAKFNPDNSDTVNKSKKQTKAIREKKVVAVEDTYAGSSFHSSPAALNLPKPSFKTSPTQAPRQAPVKPANELAFQDHPTAPPPQFPVTAYPPGSGVPFSNDILQNPVIYQQQPLIQPGFSYQVTPQGYISYPPHGATIPIPPNPNYNMITTHYQQAFPMQNRIHPKQIPSTQSVGQKISFNDLLGSSKN